MYVTLEGTDAARRTSKIARVGVTNSLLAPSGVGQGHDRQPQRDNALDLFRPQLHFINP
jgi:hypothetical protein